MTFRDWHAETDWIMSDEGLLARCEWNLGGAPQERWLRWGALPPPDKRKQIEALRLRVSEANKTPVLPQLQDFTGLKYLSGPLAYAGSLQVDRLPHSLQTLSFGESPSMKKAEIPNDLVVPSIRRVQCINGELTFSRKNFPELASAALKIDAKRAVIRQLLEYSHLDRIHLGRINTPEELSSIAPLNPTSLGLFSGRLEHLRGLAGFSRLRHLWLSSLTKLTDLSMVAELPSLESVEILYCSQLQNLVPLLSAKRLRRLVIVQCKNIELRPVLEEMIQAGFDHLAITGKTYLYRDGAEWVTNAR
jgi:hypothetical protein